MAILNTLHLNGLWHAARPRLASPRLASLGAMLNAISTRRHLARLDDRMLKDIGISRVDALAEAGRAPWDLASCGPVHGARPSGPLPTGPLASCGPIHGAGPLGRRR